jgi:hypothetical protein
MARLLLASSAFGRIPLEERTMAQPTESSGSAAERANELYWSGSMTVDDIVETVGISRTSLYAAIEPIPAGLVCADCQERMVYSNRTMRDRGVAACPNCGRESEPGDAPAGRGGEEGGGGDAWDGEDEGAGSALDGLGQWRDTLRAVSPQRVALVGGAAALGLIAGAAATRALRGEL